MLVENTLAPELNFGRTRRHGKEVKGRRFTERVIGRISADESYRFCSLAYNKIAQILNAGILQGLYLQMNQ